MNAMSGPGLVFWGFAVSGAAVDWVMSLEPHWYSTIYGLLFIVIEALIALSFTLFMLRMLSDYPPIKDSVAPKPVQRSWQHPAGVRDAVGLSLVRPAASSSGPET